MADRVDPKSYNEMIDALTADEQTRLLLENADE